VQACCSGGGGCINSQQLHAQVTGGGRLNDERTSKSKRKKSQSALSELKNMAGAEEGAGLMDTFLAAAWPVRNVYKMATANPKGDGVQRNVAGDFSGGKLKPYMLSFTDHLGIQTSSLPKIAIAVWAWLYTTDMEAAAVGYDFALDGWVAKVVCP
jgi:hypothetical protein